MNHDSKINKYINSHFDESIAAQNLGLEQSAHASNENMRLDLYLKGANHITRILKAFSES